jgi:hypothetical protein
MGSAAYKQDSDPAAEVEVNRGMLERLIIALNTLSPKLKFVVFPSGSKVCSGIFKKIYKIELMQKIRHMVFKSQASNLNPLSKKRWQEETSRGNL